MTMPLQGIKVVDLSRLLPGPFCSMILADMGAEVLKVENPAQIDPFRKEKPWIRDEGLAYLMLNRNKRAMTLNLQAEAGRAILLQLVQDADVLLEQFRPGVMERLGLGYAQLQEQNPGLIYCSISGYGQDGPYRHRGSHDINHVSITGIMEALAPQNGAPSIPRVPLGGAIGGGMWAVNSILTALLSRERQGKGQYLDVSITDGLLTLHCLFGGAYLATGQIPDYRDSQVTGAFAYYNLYETRDGRFLALGAYENKFWQEFCRWIGRPDLAPHQFAPAERQTQMIQELQEIFQQRSLAEWLQELGEEDLCLVPVNNIAEALDDPHFRARQMVTQVPYPDGYQLGTISYPVKFADAAPQVKCPPPIHGQHTHEVLMELGYSAEEIEKLRREQVI